jgi:hypothetical protein
LHLKGWYFITKFQSKFHLFFDIVFGPHFSDFWGFYVKISDFGNPLASGWAQNGSQNQQNCARNAPKTSPVGIV